VEELTEILKLKYPAKSSDIIKKTNEYIANYIWKILPLSLHCNVEFLYNKTMDIYII